MYGPTLCGDHVTLQPPTAELSAHYCRWFADKAVNLYTLRFPPSAEMAEGWLRKAAESEKEVLWMICVEGRVIGAIQIDTIDWHHRRGEIAFVIGEREHWGKGYGTEAVRLITRFAFEELNLEKLQGEAVADNLGSVRAMEKAGYGQYGLARRHFFQNGRWADSWFGEALRDTWESDQVTGTPQQ
ncbi:MAG: GNAT family N-acetyltransferase [Chloroflexota bacterium]|nr:GNAT family N-acetyltransferase [Chloroflexota bacterium]